MVESIAIIPARGGSRRLPRKNIKKLCGKPLIAWTIEAVLESNIEKCYISTEDEEIAEISKEYGAEIIERPQRLGHNRITCFQVTNHALKYLREYKELEFKYFALLPPVYPLRTAEDINNVLYEIKLQHADISLTVTKLYQPLITHNVMISKWNRIVPLPGYKGHDYPYRNYYRSEFATVVYKYRPNMSGDDFFDYMKNDIVAVETNKENNIDIDDMVDFRYVEALMRERLKNENTI